MAANPKGGAYVSIGIDTSAIKPGMDNAARLVQQGGNQIEGALQGWVGNTNAVATATEKLERQLKGFASEQRSQGRMARFYAGEIASIIPAASGAKSALEGLAGIAIEGLAGGIGIGVAFEAVKFAVQTVGEEMKRTEAISKSLADANMSASTIAENGWRRVRDMMENVTVGVKAFRDALKDSQPQIDAAMKAMNEVREKGPGLVAYMRAAFGDPAAMNQWVADYAAAGAAFQRATDAAANQAAIQQAVAGEQQKAAQSAAADRVIARDNEEKAARAREKAASAAREEAAAQKKIADELQRSVNAWMQMAGPGNASGEQQFRDNSAAQRLEDQWLPMAGPGNDQGAREFADQLQRINADSREMQGIWSSIGSSVASAFSSIGTAVGGTVGKILAWFGQMISQAIALAVSLAAAGMAWSSPLGVLATAGIVAAGMLALVGSIAARAEGGSVMGGRPYLVGERGPELVVPRNSGTVIPNHQLGGSTNITIHATDAASFERMLRNNDNALVRVLRDAGRAGRV